MTKLATDTAAQTGNPCLCSTFSIILREWESEGGQPEQDLESTGCTAWTRREFAPGHDASLKSLLIRAGVAGLAIRREMGGMTAISDAEKAAEGFGFAHMVRDGIKRGLAKAEAAAQRKQAKADRPARSRKTAAPVKPTDQADQADQAPTTKIKIGRWEYAATIDATGDAHYKNGKGEAGVAVKGTYKLV